MTKPERIEDLGRIREILSDVINDFDEALGYYLMSKHSFDEFYKHMQNSDKADDVHRSLRFHKERLHDILHIATGDFDE